jgi:hypothetical protein
MMMFLDPAASGTHVSAALMPEIDIQLSAASSADDPFMMILIFAFTGIILVLTNLN